MSDTTKIHCDTCRKTMWYGQSATRGEGRIYYAYERDGIEPLALFLVEHSGHRLHSSSDYIGDSSGIDTSEYEEVDYEFYLKDER